MSKITNKQVHNKLLIALDKLKDALKLAKQNGERPEESDSICFTLERIIEEAGEISDLYVPLSA